MLRAELPTLGLPAALDVQAPEMLDGDSAAGADIFLLVHAEPAERRERGFIFREHGRADRRDQISRLLLLVGRQFFTTEAKFGRRRAKGAFDLPLENFFDFAPRSTGTSLSQVPM